MVMNIILSSEFLYKVAKIVAFALAICLPMRIGTVQWIKSLP